MPRRLPLLPPSPLPPLYTEWMSDLLDGPLPEESKATCDNCAMLPVPGDTGGDATFDPTSKCCTYLPQVANFLVGRVLRDKDPRTLQGRKTVEERIEKKIAVSPLGLLVPAPYRTLYSHSTKHDEFGRNASMRCPHYLEGASHNCGIWANRSAICSTWFCKHMRGSVGLEFWRNGVLPLLAAAEHVLARWCVLELGIDGATLRRLYDDEPDGGSQLRHDPKRYADDWGAHVGKERQFFIQSAALVDGLAWKDVVKIGGVDLRARAKIARDLYDQHASQAVPERLTTGAFQMVRLTRERVLISSYSGHDPVGLSAKVMKLLPYFDGRLTKVVRREIQTADGVTLEDSLILKLADFEILVPAPPPPPAPVKAR